MAALWFRIRRNPCRPVSVSAFLWVVFSRNNSANLRPASLPWP